VLKNFTKSAIEKLEVSVFWLGTQFVVDHAEATGLYLSDLELLSAKKNPQT
jgi:hypothetical protein